MEQKYIYSFSQIEDKVKALHETNTEAAAAVALSWLGPEYSMGFFITDVNSAYEAAEKQELSPINVLKMRYFYEKHSAKLSGEPEDRVFLKEILRSVGESEADMEKQFAEYEKDAPEKI